MNMCFFFHKWTKYVEVKRYIPGHQIATKYMLAPCYDYSLRRECLRCGLVKEKHLRQEVLA